jgi:hypothetical protein
VFEQGTTTLAGEALPIQFHHGGAWHPGALVGWRHEQDGSCSMRLQFVVGGLRRTTWMPMVDVRLLEPATAARRGPEARTRPDVPRPDPDWARLLPSLTLVRRPREVDADRSRV